MVDLSAHHVLGVPIHIPTGIPPQASLEGYQDWLSQRLEEGMGSHVVTCNAEMAMLAQRDPQFGQVLQKADLVIPDGAGVVWALGRQGVRVYRAPGIELAERLLQFLGSLGSQDCRVALIGAKPEINQQALHHWQQRCPQLSIWAHHGYFDDAGSLAIVQTLREFQPQVVLVGLGSPRQEFWIRDQRQVVPQALWMGVGGSFDIWAGSKPRAPEFWRANRLEWLYRLWQEPQRWRRMAVLPAFVWKVLTQG